MIKTITKTKLFFLKSKSKNYFLRSTKMSTEVGGRGRGAKRKIEQNNASASKKLRGELQTPFLGPNA